MHALGVGKTLDGPQNDGREEFNRIQSEMWAEPHAGSEARAGVRVRVGGGLVSPLGAGLSEAHA